jgi:hypothetical protein
MAYSIDDVYFRPLVPVVLKMKMQGHDRGSNRRRSSTCCGLMFANHLWIAKPSASSSSSVVFQLGSEGKGGDGIRG